VSVKYRIWVVEDAKPGTTFTVDGWFVNSVIDTWLVDGKTYVMFLLEEDK
jgi:hypothetical protein